MILAVDKNNGIGFGNKIPWHSSADFKHFKEETAGKVIIMGYNTWKSLPKKPLPGRLNIVLLSRDYNNREEVDSNPSVLFLPEETIWQIISNNPDCVVIGGARLYRTALPFIDTVILSRINGDYECDTHFDIHSDSNTHLELGLVKLLEDGTMVEYWNNIK